MGDLAAVPHSVPVSKHGEYSVPRHLPSPRFLANPWRKQFFRYRAQKYATRPH